MIIGASRTGLEGAYIDRVGCATRRRGAVHVGKHDPTFAARSHAIWTSSGVAFRGDPVAGCYTGRSRIVLCRCVYGAVAL